ncbi:MAG: Fic family protein [Proteobacteria bacterium]|nr:Fic family protein [Pseudomonadota bacterium]
MPIKYTPNYTITPKIAESLMRIEAIKTQFHSLSITPTLLKSSQESARFNTIHYSTALDGHHMTLAEVNVALNTENDFIDRAKEVSEVRAYNAAISQIETWASEGRSISESMIQTLNACLMSNSVSPIQPTSYRSGEIAIRNTTTQTVVYVPPEAKDIPNLIHALFSWIKSYPTILSPLVAGIAHYQFTAIHPYRNGNGRTARLLTALILYLSGYDLNGLVVLEEHYAKDVKAYYRALHLGDSHNYYLGRAVVNMTPWLEYFIEGMMQSFENVLLQFGGVSDSKTSKNKTQKQLRTLDLKQRKVLKLFEKHELITSSQIGKLFQFKPRTSSGHCKRWVEKGFLEVVDISKKGRKYKLAEQYQELFS